MELQFSPDEPFVTLDEFQALCRELASEKRVEVRITDSAIFFLGTAEEVRLEYSIDGHHVSVVSREYCPGYEGTADGREFVIYTITDHIEISRGNPVWMVVSDES